MDKPVSWRRPKGGRRDELTPEERENVRKAIRVLRTRHGGADKLAKALGVSTPRVEGVMTTRGKPGAAIALYVARLAGVHVEDVLSGAFPAPGACPMCGRVTEGA